MAFNEKYSHEQRDAMAQAHVDLGLTAKRVVDMAAAGELSLNGQRLPPFQATASTVRDKARQLRRRRAGQTSSRLADQPHRDAVETLRRRLVSAADVALTRLERDLAKPKLKPDVEQLRQIARAGREIAALPGRDDPRPPAPGLKVNGRGGRSDGGTTQGGIPARSSLHTAETQLLSVSR